MNHSLMWIIDRDAKLLFRRVAQVWRSEGFSGIQKRIASRMHVKRQQIEHFMRLAVPRVRLTFEDVMLWLLKRKTPFGFMINGNFMLLKDNDPGISRELAIYRVHEPVVSQLLPEYLKGCNTVMDIGANLGYYSLLCLNTLPPHAKLISIEPDPSNFAFLKRNISVHPMHNSARILQIAVGAESGRAILYQARESNWHTLVKRDARHVSETEVDVRTIDDLVSDLDLTKVDLIRMDIEGQEELVFEGMRETIKLHRPRLVIELHPQLVGAQPIRGLVQALLKQYQYRVTHIVDRERDYPWIVAKAPMACTIDDLLELDLTHRCFTILCSPS